MPHSCVGCYSTTLLIPGVKSPPTHCQYPTHKEKQTPGMTLLPEPQGKVGSLGKTANCQSALTGTQSVLPSSPSSGSMGVWNVSLESANGTLALGELRSSRAEFL